MSSKPDPNPIRIRVVWIINTNFHQQEQEAYKLKLKATTLFCYTTHEKNWLYLLLHELLQDNGEHLHRVDRLLLEANARGLVS